MDEDPAMETVSSSSQLEIVRTTELECATAALLSLEVDLRRSGEELVEEHLEEWSWNPNRLLIALAVSDMNAIFVNEFLCCGSQCERERERDFGGWDLKFREMRESRVGKKKKWEGGVIGRWRFVEMQRSRWGRVPFEIAISKF